MACLKLRREAILESLKTILGEPDSNSSDPGTYICDVVDGRYVPSRNKHGKKRLEYVHEIEWRRGDERFDVDFYDDATIYVTIWGYGCTYDEIRSYDDVSVPVVLMTAADFINNKIVLIKNPENPGIPIITHNDFEVEK